MLTTNRPLIQRPWVIPLGLLTVGFVAYSLLPYLGLNPDNARVALRDGFPLHYPLLVAHIFLGSVALLAACLQVWPWLRQNHPTVHRRSGRVYVCVAVPAGLFAIGLSPHTLMGLNAQVGNVLFGIVWVTATVVGFRMARQHRFTEHRVWMVRSFALAFAIVVNRLWMPLCILTLAPDGPRMLQEQAAGLSMWLSWVGNLLIAEWWLHHTHNRARKRAADNPADTAHKAPVGA